MADKEPTNQDDVNEAEDTNNKEAVEQAEKAKPNEEDASPGRVVAPEATDDVEVDLDDEPQGDELIKEKQEIPKRDSDAPLIAADIKKEQTDSSSQATLETEDDMPTDRLDRKKRLVMVAISLVVVALVSIGAWLFFEYNSPERVFSDMLANQLDTETVTYDVGTEHNAANFALTATVDATDRDNPKTTGAFDIALDFGFLGSFDVQYNVVTTGETLYMNFANFNVANTISDEQAEAIDNPFESVQDNWVEVSLSEAEEQLNNRDFGAASFARGALFGTGAVLTGNFTTDQQDTLLSLIESNDVYEITDTSEDIINEANTYRYEVSLNNEGLKQLYQQANDFYALGLDEADIEAYASGIESDSVTLWVDRSTRHLARLEFTEEDEVTDEQAETEEELIVVTVDFTDYNEPASIEAPASESRISIDEFEELVGPTF